MSDRTADEIFKWIAVIGGVGGVAAIGYLILLLCISATRMVFS